MGEVNQSVVPPPGWELDAEGRLRREKIASMLRRLEGWDYRGRAIYQITITLADRSSQALGRLKVKGRGGEWLEVSVARQLGLKPEEVEARVALTPLGEAVARCWAAIPRFYPGVRVLLLQIMPDHFHGLIFVEKPLDCHLGQVIKGFKTGCNQAARELGFLSSATLSPSSGQGAAPSSGQGAAPSSGQGAAALKTASPAVGRAARAKGGAGLFAEGFQDTVLLHRGQLDNMFNYLRDNPRRLAIKRLFPELFKVVGELKVKLDLAAGGGPEGPRPAEGGGDGGGPEGPRPAIGRFAALGNQFLLGRPLAQVQVSRRDFVYRRVPKPGGGRRIARDAAGRPLVDYVSPLFEEKKAALFAAAKHGHALISPCVSDGERELARLALAALLPLVTMQNKGFSPLQKPSGRYFDACSDGRLLMLAPAAWPYQPGEKPMTRDDATAMNRLCQWIVGPDSAEINYHGMKPENIDTLAISAAKIV